MFLQRGNLLHVPLSEPTTSRSQHVPNPSTIREATQSASVAVRRNAKPRRSRRPPQQHTKPSNNRKDRPTADRAAKHTHLDAQIIQELEEILLKQQYARHLQDGNFTSAWRQVRDAAGILTKRWPMQQKKPWQGTPYFSRAFDGQHQQFFRMSLRARRLDAALEYARWATPSAALYTSLLKESVQHGDLYAVTQVVEARREAGFPEDAYCYTALLKAAARERNPARTEAIFDRAWQQGIRGAPIFNVLIGHQNELRNTKAAFATFERMLLLGVEPDAVTMNLLIKAAASDGRLDKAEELYRQMRVLGPAPTSVTYVHMFQAFQGSRSKDPARILQVWEDMREQVIAPVTQHFVTFLGACCRAPLSARETRQAFGRALAFCGGAGGDCSVYAALLKFCVAQDIPEKAADVWRATVKGEHEVDTWMYTGIFTACAAYNSPELRMVMSQAYQNMEAQWQRLQASGTCTASSKRGWIVAYNSLLNGCAKSGVMAAAEEVMKGMQEEGPAPDVTSYNTLISGYAKAANTVGAFDVFHELCEASKQPETHPAYRLRPDAHTFGALLHACAAAGNAYSAKRVMELMKLAGIPAGAQAYTSLMHACIKEGSQDNIQYAFQVFENMKAQGVQPTAVTYGCMMNGYDAAGRVDGAFKLYQEACFRGVFPSDELHNILINIFAKNDRLEEALDVVKALAKTKGSQFQAGALNSLARALAPQYVHRSLRLISIMNTLKLRVHRDTLVALIQACAQESLIDSAHRLYWVLSEEGAAATREAGSHLITALCRSAQTEKALAVYEDMVLANTPVASAPQLPPLPHAPLTPTQPPQVAEGLQKLEEDAPKAEETRSSATARDSAMQLPPETEQRFIGRVHPHPEFELSAADQLGLRRLVVYDDALAATAMEQEPRPAAAVRPQRNKQAVFPHARAVAALVQAFAHQDLDKAFTLYQELQRDSAEASSVTLSNRLMWQSLIESACRNHRLSMALQVFDDWKDYCSHQIVHHRFDDDAFKFVPHLSNATLAYLEASCRQEANNSTGERADKYMLRVFDVCATMRQQEDRKLQASLPRPPKPSHHFADEET